MLRQLSYIIILWILMIINGELANEWIHMESVSSGLGELFTWESRASEDLLHTCQVYLKGKGAAELEKAVMDVSDPSSRNYGKHLSKVAPSLPFHSLPFLLPFFPSSDPVIRWCDCRRRWTA